MRLIRIGLFSFAAASLAIAGLASPAHALDYITLRRGGQETKIEGKQLVKASDGMLFQARDGVLWTVLAEELVSSRSDQQPFEPYSAAELAERLKAELPKGFETYATAHYVVLYNTPRGYAQWCGGLFERLYTAFTNFWTRKGFKLHDPEFPLVAVVFADPESYQQYSKGELGDAGASIIGYYSLETNRITMYDLTGVAAAGRGSRRGTAAQINQVLAQPEAERTVATIIHEATHQIAFNCGLNTRYADVPLWVTEGVAMYFETPDLGSAKGWRTIGAVNRVRLARFRDYLSRRPANSLETLLGDDKRMRDPQQALDAYAEAWTLTYFLLRQRPQQYVAYLESLSKKERLLWDNSASRLEDFKKAFGDDLPKLDRDFLRQVEKVR
ncbi:MAG: DUF1570 domain-containing protein [Pirellulales bacterium]